VRRPRPRRRRPLRYWLLALVVVVAFGAGLALGQSLEDKPSPRGTQTSIRTLKPLELPPTPETVTVTVSR
jgi:hypothetical protein